MGEDTLHNDAVNPGGSQKNTHNLNKKSRTMRSAQYFSQVEARLLTDAIFESKECKNTLQSMADKLKKKQEIIVGQKKELEEKSTTLLVLKRKLA